MAASACTSRSPETPLELTSTFRFSGSIDAASSSNCCAVIGAGWWLWMSMTGNLARGTGCCGTTSVDFGLYSRIVGGGNWG